MSIWKKMAGFGLVMCLAATPASAQELNPNQFGLGDIVSILGGGNRGGYGYYPDQQRGGIDVSDLIGIASILYQTTQQNRQPYYPQPGYYPNQYPPPNQYPYQYPSNYPPQYPHQQPGYYPPNNHPYYR